MMRNLSLQRRQVKEHKLSRLYLECTVRCNLNCQQCGLYCRTLPDLKDMPQEHIVKILENVAKVETSSEVTVILTGGEPLLRPDLLELGSQIHLRGFSWGIHTNGILLDKEMLTRCKALGMKFLSIGFQGMEYEHEWLTQTKGSFERVVETLRLVAQHPDVELEVTTLVNQRNFDYLNEICQFLLSLGVSHWRLYTAFPTGKGKGNDELHLESYQLRQLMEFIQRERKAAKLDIFYSCEGFLGRYEKEVRDEFYMCQSGISIASVLINGDITGCPNVCHKFAQGNIYEGDEVMDVWNTCFDAFRNRKWMHSGICTHCKAFRYCQGNGMHLRDNTGDMMMCNYDRLNPV